MKRMAAKARLRLNSQDVQRYSIVPLPDDIGLALKCSENMKGIIDKITPASASAQACAKHTGKQVTQVCKTCDDHLICDECQSNDHIGHAVELIMERFELIRSRLQTARRNMDKINERCKIANDENQNEENEVVSLFDKLRSDFQKSQDVVYKRLAREEADLKTHEQNKIKSIHYAMEADQRLYEVEAIEALTSIEEKIQALENEKEVVQEQLQTKLKQREKETADQIDAVNEDVRNRRKANKDLEEQLKSSTELFQKLYDELKSVADSHAKQCRDTISNFLDRYQEIMSRIAAFDNGSAPLEFLLDLSDLTGESNPNMNNIAHDSFVLDIPRIRYKSSKEGRELGQFIIYPGEEERMKFTWGRSNHKTWYIENISGLSNQLIAVVTRKRGSKESYLDLLSHRGEDLTSIKLPASRSDSYRFVCAVSPHRLATCCECEVSLMNIDDGTIQITHKLGKGEEAWQIAYNRKKKEILVGLVGSNDLRVFDDSLNYLRSVTMPTTERAPLSLATDGDNIFVCTYENSAFALDGKDGSVRTVFPRNGVENRAWRICCDSLGMVYVMWLRWEGVVSVIRYNINGEQYSCLDVDSNMRFLSFALIQNGAEQLIVASEEGEFSINRTPSRVEDAMVRAADGIAQSNHISVMSIWKPM